jgi:DNA-binding transcriptional regulator YiaG
MSASPEPARAGEVVSIRSRAGYQADYQGLASAQVSAARAKLGLTSGDFAQRLGALIGWMPSPAVVERWERGSTPPGDVVLAAAVMMQEVPGDVLTLPLSRTAARRADLMSAIGPALDFSEAVKPYADRGVITRQQWNGIVEGSADEIWLYGMAEFGYASDDEVPGILKEAVGQGCSVRVLLLDPDYPGSGQIDADEGSPPGTVAARIRASLARFRQMQQACGERMQVRVYSAQPTVSVVRGDGQMFVTPYLRFFIGSNSPTFEIWAKTAPKMFSRYERHFEDTWDRARDWT